MRGFHDFVVLEGIEIILNIDRRTLLDRACPKEGVRRGRDLDNEDKNLRWRERATGNVRIQTSVWETQKQRLQQKKR